MHPFDADAAQGLLDRILGRTQRVVGGRGRYVLSAGGSGVAVVHHDHDVIALVEDGIAEARGKTVMPEATVADERDGALTRHGIEGGCSRSAESVAHRGVADVERGKHREEMAADVATHVVRSELALDEFHCRKDRAFRTAGTERGRSNANLSRDGPPRGRKARRL